jgi:hypothetical protein
MDNKHTTTLTKVFWEPYVNSLAKNQSRERKLGLFKDPSFLDSIKSTDEEMRHDWDNACDIITLQIAEGIIDFPLIGTDSYYFLEGTWWKMVKQASAYLRWKADSAKTEAQYYDDASRSLRQRLFKDQKSGTFEEFEKVKNYITKKYLDEDGRFSDSIKRDAHALLANKAKKISETTGEERSVLNWHRAKVYASMYYENIIGAVIGQEKEKKEKTVKVLRAFEFSKSPKNRYLIISGFEAIVAIYFLDKQLIKSILQDSDIYDFNCVPVDSWPENLVLPKICEGKFRYEADQSQITYLGIMTDEERDALLEIVTQDDHKRAIVYLYDQSHLTPYEEMVF